MPAPKISATAEAAAKVRFAKSLRSSIGAGVYSSHATKAMPVAPATVRSATMACERQPSRWPCESPSSSVNRKSDISAKPIQSKRCVGPLPTRPGRKSSAMKAPITQTGTAMKNT